MSSIRRSNATTTAAIAAAVASGSPTVSISTVLKELPVLRLRKDIWEHFPVCLEKLEPSEDNRDRYYVRWHRKNLATWSQGIPQYSAIAKLRLIGALKANTNDWIIRDAPAEKSAICMLEMALPEERAVVVPSNYSNALNPATPAPAIKSLEDIRDNYPVCWKLQNDGSSVLSYHDRQLGKLAELMRRPVDELRGLVHEKLLNSLWSGGWIIDTSAAGPNTIGVISRSTCSPMES